MKSTNASTDAVNICTPVQVLSTPGQVLSGNYKNKLKWSECTSKQNVNILSLLLTSVPLLAMIFCIPAPWESM